MGAKKKVLAAYVHVAGQVFKPGDSPDKEFADQITNPKAWEGAEVDEPDEPVAKSLDEMTAGELKAEIGTRNAKRSEADALSDKGNKGELLERLKADDAAAATA